MTYKELKAHIEMMDAEQQNTDVTIYNTRIDEYFAAADLDYAGEDGNGILDPFHPFIVLDY